MLDSYYHMTFKLYFEIAFWVPHVFNSHVFKQAQPHVSTKQFMYFYAWFG